jgi:hypothetical protein
VQQGDRSDNADNPLDPIPVDVHSAWPGDRPRNPVDSRLRLPGLPGSLISCHVLLPPRPASCAIRFPASPRRG